MSGRRRELLTFAFVSRALSTHDDIFFGLTPLFWPIAEAHAGQLFDSRRFVQAVRDMYGLPMTTDVAEEFVPRLVEAHLLKSQLEGRSHGIYVWAPAPLAGERGQERDNVLEIVDQLGEKFAAFADDLPTMFKINLSKDQLTELLFDWLISTESSLRHASYAMELLGAADAVAGAQAEAHPEKQRFRREEDYLCSRFVMHLRQTSPALFDHIAQIAAAVLVSEVVLEIKSPSRKLETLSDFTVFLDGPFVMDILNLSGVERHQNAMFVVTKLRNLGARMFVFSHSLEEIKANLSGVLNRPLHSRTGPTGDAIRQGAVSEDYAKAALHDSETLIQRASIQIVDARQGVSASDFRFFDDATCHQFSQELQGWPSEVVRRRDAESVAAVMRRRRGQQSRDMFHVSHVLVSHNPALCRIAHRFCVEEAMIRPEQVGPAVHQRRVAALVWISAGTDERLEISRRQLVANCAVAIQSRPDVIEAMRAKLRQVKPDLRDQFDALLSRPRSVQLAMDLTLSSAAAIQTENMEEVFEIIKKSAIEAEQSQFNEQLKQVKSKFGKQINAKDMEIGSLSDRVEKFRGELEDSIGTDKTFFAVLVRFAGLCGTLLRIVISLVLSIAIVLVFTLDALQLKQYLGDIFRYAAAVVAIVVALWPIWIRKTEPLERLVNGARQLTLNWLASVSGKGQLILYADVKWPEGTISWRGRYAGRGADSGQLL